MLYVIKYIYIYMRIYKYMHVHIIYRYIQMIIDCKCACIGLASPKPKPSIFADCRFFGCGSDVNSKYTVNVFMQKTKAAQKKKQIHRICLCFVFAQFVKTADIYCS